MLEHLRLCPLFQGMSEAEIQACIKDSRALLRSYEKEEIIFSQGDKPRYLNILLSGSVAVCNDSNMGKRSIVAIFKNAGELFGEVFLFLQKQEYEHYAQATQKSEVLLIPKAFILQEDSSKAYHAKLLANMLFIFAGKTYYLNRRVQILSCAGLRQKLARLIMQLSKDGKTAYIGMNREELSDFLNAARPSVSRELMKMQEEGLITVEKNKISIHRAEELLDL